MAKKNSVKYQEWSLQKRRNSINVLLTNEEYPNEPKMTNEIKKCISSESHIRVVIKCSKNHLLKGQFRYIKHCKFCDKTLNDVHTNSILVNHGSLVEELDPSYDYDKNKLRFDEH